MTDGQIRYQTLKENQRHNLEMERFGEIEAQAKRESAQASTRQAEASLKQAEAAAKNAKTNENKLGWDIGFHFAEFLFPDANTALSSGAKVISSLFG